MAKHQNPKKKETINLYKKIYRLGLFGMHHADIKEKLNISQSTVDRAINWCHETGYDAAPKDDALLEMFYKSALARRLELHALMVTSPKPSDKTIIKKEIREQEKDIMVTRGLIINKNLNLNVSRDEIPDDVLDKFLKENYKFTESKE